MAKENRGQAVSNVPRTCLRATPSRQVHALAVSASVQHAALAPVAGLVFLTGMCALTFQVAWFREFRLVFGASTAASSAVLAVFMGGLGIGNALLGKWADRAKRPLALYA